MSDIYLQTFNALKRVFASEMPVVVNVCGTPGSGKRSILQRAAYELGFNLQLFKPKDIDDFDKAGNEGRLPILVTDGEDDGDILAAIGALADKFYVFAVTSVKPCPFLREIDLPLYTAKLPLLTSEERHRLWNEYLPECPVNLRYSMTPKNIRRAAEAARILAYAKDCPITENIIQRAIRQEVPNALGDLARFLPATYTWDDLILSESSKKMLRVVIDQVKNRSIVEEEWGFRNTGISAIFYGSPGTGKTMAAKVLSAELNLDLYRVDLSSMYSKYIGETSKNISELFKKAENINAILFFDEADALFAKRSEVKDSHDKNANSEAAHLLQQLESYDGLVIMATNLMSNIDPAFKRRIKHMVSFNPPSEAERLMLWQSILPKSVPLSEKLDFEYFSKEFDLSGSAIKDTLYGAAHLAAAKGGGLSNAHIAWVLKLTLAQNGKIVLPTGIKYLN